MIYDGCTSEELQTLLHKNGETKDALVLRLRLMDSGEEEIIRKMQADTKAVELLSTGWTGEAAKKYITQAQESNELFRKKYLQAFSQEREQIHNEQKRLQAEEQDISDALAKQNNSRISE